MPTRPAATSTPSHESRPAWIDNATRHRNPDGSQGGWVADTATVSPAATIGHSAMVLGDARVGGNAWVSGDAMVLGGARVLGGAHVSGDAHVDGDAWVLGGAHVSGDAMVGGNARVLGNARVGGDAEILATSHCITIGPVGSEGRIVTVYRAIKSEHRIVAGCWQGTVDQLVERIAPDGDHGWDSNADRWRADYRLVIAVARHRITEWADEAEEARRFDRRPAGETA